MERKLFFLKNFSNDFFTKNTMSLVGIFNVKNNACGIVYELMSIFLFNLI